MAREGSGKGEELAREVVRGEALEVAPEVVKGVAIQEVVMEVARRSGLEEWLTQEQQPRSN